MADREVCIVPATSAAHRSIRRHFREWKANSASLIQPCVANYVKGRRQLRLRQEGSPLHLLIANGTCSPELLQQKVTGGKMAHPATAFDFRDVHPLRLLSPLLSLSPASDSTGMPIRRSPTLSSAARSVRQHPSPSHSSSQAISASSIFQQPSVSGRRSALCSASLHLPCDGAAEGRWRHIPCAHHGGVLIHSCLRALSRYGLRPYPRDTRQRLDRLPKI